MEHELLTLSEVAELLRVPLATARYWRTTGKGPHSARIGRRVLFRREEVDRYISEAFADAA